MRLHPPCHDQDERVTYGSCCRSQRRGFRQWFQEHDRWRFCALWGNFESLVQQCELGVGGSWDHQTIIQSWFCWIPSMMFGGLRALLQHFGIPIKNRPYRIASRAKADAGWDLKWHFCKCDSGSGLCDFKVKKLGRSIGICGLSISVSWLQSRCASVVLVRWDIRYTGFFCEDIIICIGNAGGPESTQTHTHTSKTISALQIFFSAVGHSVTAPRLPPCVSV